MQYQAEATQRTQSGYVQEEIITKVIEFRRNRRPEADMRVR
jgi:hypothetical protein